ncbi:hypothetical protein F4777DRAFT_584927 [Nemania sp. FL0916]|nr:hypothetical protein F4777DRAFT_584927 [Nemania sp. FL0916]
MQCTNHSSGAVLPTSTTLGFEIGSEVIGVWAWQSGHAHGIANQSHIYSIIQARDPGLAARYLAHITDNGTRVIGFLRTEPPALGIAYGRPQRPSFLICGCGCDAALLQGFGGSFETTDKEVLGRELEGLEQVLAQQPSELEKSNAPLDMELSDKLLKFQSHGSRTHSCSGSSRTISASHGLLSNTTAKQRFGGSATDVAVVGAANNRLDKAHFRQNWDVDTTLLSPGAASGSLYKQLLGTSSYPNSKF